MTTEPIEPTDPIEPLRLAFSVDCSREHAFMVWTERIATWWPTDHTSTGEPNLVVVLEGRVGGRIFERTAGGVEHDWGEVLVWEPPGRLVYSWHLRRDRTDATEVEIRFRPMGRQTRVEIEHRGWERLGADGRAWRDRNLGGWSTLLPHFIDAVGGGTIPDGGFDA
jgi:uncharacterized protein YndB with AHSA1/START domain